VEAYHVRTKVFDGPLDLLLALIEKRKLLINDIALSEVTDDYLKHIEQYPHLPVAETAQFVLVGSTLLLIKSKSLLPVLSLTEDEQDSIVDIEYRLKLFGHYKKIARTVVEQFDAQPIYARNVVRKRAPEFSPDASMTVEQLELSLKHVIDNLPVKKQTLPKTVVEKVVSLEDMIDTLSERINTSMQISFRQFSTNVSGSKLNVIVSFLAMLELVRQGVIRVEQQGKFSDIQMHADTVHTPRYS
jgi:segregation and condensation protein A